MRCKDAKNLFVRIKKKQIKEKAKSEKTKKMLWSELQQVLQTPHIQTNIVFYKRELDVHTCNNL